MASLFPISIAVVPLYSAYLCVSVCVCEYVSVCVLLLLFFSDCRIYLFSSLAARVFNKPTRYSLSYVSYFNDMTQSIELGFGEHVPAA